MTDRLPLTHHVEARQVYVGDKKECKGFDHERGGPLRFVLSRRPLHTAATKYWSTTTLPTWGMKRTRECHLQSQ
ncbi:hypothetical protein J6590_054771 [Homalodisca vitripennis]|nr:hypothetical protein J6590_054771 [Homalodisca vitripennis]